MSKPNGLLYERLLNSLLVVDRVQFHEILAELLAMHSPLAVLEEYVTPVLQRIGSGWGEGQYALSQMYMGGKLCEEVIPTLLKEHVIPQKNKVPLAIAVLQDHHILGKKIVYYALRSSGYHLIDYGSVETPKELVERAQVDGIRILLISTLMLPSALLVKEVKHCLDEKKSSMKVVVGGAPFNFDSELWKDVGADAMCLCATETIPLVAKLLKEIEQ